MKTGGRQSLTVATMRLIRAGPSLVDGVLAAGLGVLAQAMVWSGRVAGPRVAVAALFLLVGFPLIVRRRAPLVPVVLLMTAIAVQSVATSDAAEGAPLLLPALASAYAVAAYGSRRVALAGLLVAMAGLGVQIAFDPLARTPEQLWAAAVFVLLVAAAWLVGLAAQVSAPAESWIWRYAGCSTEADWMDPPAAGGVRCAVQQATLRRRSRATARWPRRWA